MLNYTYRKENLFMKVIKPSESMKLCFKTYISVIVLVVQVNKALKYVKYHEDGLDINESKIQKQLISKKLDISCFLFSK